MDRIKKLKELLQVSPADAFLQHALALEIWKGGDTAEAIRLFKKVLEEDENYIGSYYQLGKALEEQNKPDEAVHIYEKGMLKAKEAGEHHAYNELRSAYEELTF
ncbi:MAG TPA: tetratricopeptide repeat protein [Chitinophagaceae bacterium]|nr:tetratricopeptide repeat protein [Chitinophagaceae bacterium]